MSEHNRHAILTFRLADQYYALPVECVVEVVAMMTLAKIPNAPEAILGMINRHGEPLPIIDLRIAFGFDSSAPVESTLFIVAQQNEYQTGLIVDEILQVRYVASKAFKDAHGASKYVSHVISSENHLYQQIRLNALYQDYLVGIQP